MKLVVHPQARPLVGSVPVPSDKSIAHRALIVGALANGKSVIVCGDLGADNRATLSILRRLGVGIEETSTGPRASTLRVTGTGLYGLSAPNGPLDCENSGTTMRLLSGVLAGQAFGSTLIGDASLSRRPMQRVVGPLSRRGAHITGRPDERRPGELTAPIEIAPLGDAEYLGPLELETEVASAQVKGAALLSGLFAHGPTWVREPFVSRDHTERLLAAVGVPIETVGSVVVLDPSGWKGSMSPIDLTLPGDLSAAAFLLAAAAVVPGSRVTVRGVGLNPSRAGFLEIARDMGAGIELMPRGDQGGEPVGDVAGFCAPLARARVGGELLVRAIDEVPILCALAARASGTTRFTDAAELRVKESDRVGAMADVLRAFGVRAVEHPDGLEIIGTDAPLRAATVESRGDHRIAMTAAVLGLLADGPSTVLDVDNVRTSFPRFVGTLRALGARLEVVAGTGRIE